MASMASKAYLIGQSRLPSYASSSTSEILVLRTRLRTRFPVASFLHIYAHIGHHNPKFTLSSSPTLLSLSSHILTLSESTTPYDLSFLHALLLQSLFLLHDGTPRVNQVVFGIGRMVNVARLMGLGRGPDEFVQGGSRGVKEGVVKEEAKGRYTIWKAEMRRRVWWEVFYYDLFISDSLGLTLLIADDQHTCRLPAEVDDEAFTPKSSVLPLLSPVSALESDVVGTGSSNGVSVGGVGYFIQKCR
ncbi:hypothetical protein M422DRAFT_258072 [Sphaerobolus stellatus SS14]|uniref:Unplaced genomic scaffold SPHSTscaffold_79, whole genome shotgun sequence n=1 Tax=Sphaerobolus stellatus (strain SS14) TaxID=990650 RepID=A0A0C9VN53_SPHS4|nr:hypothetical protein M422DRAFT_258072 [Sphaerobolus stellatus SS14]